MKLAANGGGREAARLFYAAVLLTFAIQVFLAAIIPITADEAYYIGWGERPALGYYDHPPMIGWLLHVLLYFGRSEVWLRLPAILASTLVGIALYVLLKRDDKIKAAFTAILFLLSPVNTLTVLITTDAPLFLFSFLSAVFLRRAIAGGSRWQYVLAGVFLGLAFLSKYFAVLLALAYGVYFLFTHKDRNKTIGFLLMLLAAAPAGLLNLYWNYTHCWDNVLFNLFNRNEDAAFSLKTAFSYAGIVLYLVTPPVLFYLYKHRGEMVAKTREKKFDFFVAVALVPFLVFAALSLVKDIGLHWVLSFYPFLFFLAYALFTREELATSIRFMTFFLAAHVAVVLLILALPLHIWKDSVHYDSIIFTIKNDEIQKQIKPYEGRYRLATDRYATSAIMSFLSGKYFLVFGHGTHHGRQDDIETDFSKYKHQNILVLMKTRPVAEDFTPFFKSVEIREFQVDGVPFYLLLGSDFHAENYRRYILLPVTEEYYRIPQYLPQSGCYMSQRYSNYL